MVRPRRVHSACSSYLKVALGIPERAAAPGPGELAARAIAIPYGYSRGHRADVQQWMLALATTGHGDVPLCTPARDGPARDKVNLVAARAAGAAHLRVAAAGEDAAAAPIVVADRGAYSAAHGARVTAAGVRWISRVPETATAAQAALDVAEDLWQAAGDLHWAPGATVPVGERWVVVRSSKQGEARARTTLARQAESARHAWEQQRWHWGNQRFACVADAQAALAKRLQQCPAWLSVAAQVVARRKHAGRGRPRR